MTGRYLTGNSHKDRGKGVACAAASQRLASMRPDFFCLVLFLGLGAAAPGWAQPAPEEESFNGPLARFDTNHDGTISLAEMNAVLKADFDKVDRNHDGQLNGSEISAENDRRAEADANATLLFDWKGSGFVDFEEFAAPMHTLFAQLDRNKGRCSHPERSGPCAPANSDGSAPAQSSGRGSGHRRH